MSNVCTSCHEGTDGFFSAAASDAMKSSTYLFYTGADQEQTSHFWGGKTSTVPAAGATNPPSTFYFSRYSISTKRLTCTICHNPHGEADTQLLRMTKDDDLICQQCHTGFYVDYPKARMTHHIGSYAAANQCGPLPKKFKLVTPHPVTGKLDTNTDGGEIRLVNRDGGEIRMENGKVSCTSCHAPHFADSDSSTADSVVGVGGLRVGDGHLLKADGPSQTNKSALCQTCHTYKEHGKVGNDAFGSGVGDIQIGCLVCHSGHVYDATAPNYYVLRKSVDSLAAGFNSKTTLYTTETTLWKDYCISCHGLPQYYPSTLRGVPHTNNEDCKACHAHDASTYSFGQGTGGAACTSCHGAPPRTDTAANRDDNSTPDTGYAVGSNGVNYRTDNGGATGKDESQTPHKVHAGALNADKVSTDYVFGSGSTLAACLPCHNDKEDAVSPPSTTHDEADSNGSFQDVYFSDFATYNWVLSSPTYSGTTCSGIYCHSNGGRRPATGAAKTLGDFKTATTKAWPLGSTTNKIIGTATECQQCHGENTATMAIGGGATQKSNSQSHIKHVSKYDNSKTACYLCHSATVDNTGTIPAAARDHRTGTNGTHVDGKPDVVFTATGINGELAAGSYLSGPTQGTCTVYCHSDGNGGPGAVVPDWDVQGNIVCGSCHGITATTLTSGSHPIHINSTKAKIKCSACHPDDADTGTHGGHVDGVATTRTKADSCNTCHGVELASGKAWDVEPTWGSAASADCRTCHTGSVLTSYVNTSETTIVVNTVNNLSKPLHESDGHSRTTPYPLTGKPQANKNCTACHVMPTPTGTGHVDGLGNSKLLIGSFSCEACHTAAGSRSGEATVRVQTHGNQTAGYTKKAHNDAFTKTCLACHDPHGTSNGAMVETLKSKQNAKDISANYAGDVVFSALLVGNSFDEADSGAGANNDDICATCHSTALHNNRAVSGSHHEGENCTTTCHQHNSAKGGFMPAVGTACNQCHGNPPNTGAHGDNGLNAIHAQTAIHTTAEDRTDCAYCHPGADLYTYDQSNDVTNGTGEQRNHGSGNRLTKLASKVGYQKDGPTSKWYCATACHLSNTTDGFWYIWDNVAQPLLPAASRTGADTVLECNTCHYWSNSPSSGGNVAVGRSEAVGITHNKHFDSGRICITCHPDNSGDTGINITHTHIDDHDLWSLNNTNDGSVLEDRGNATPNEATVNVTTWNDTTDSCANAACHNPSGVTKSATWGTPNGSGCDFCHSSTNPDAGKGTPGSHGAHMSALGTFGIDTIDCTSCHPNNVLIGNAHLNEAIVLDLNDVTATYSASLTDYTSSTWGQCTTTTCHNNGRGVAVPTPVWGTASTANNCTICHAAPPVMANSRHAEHVANTGWIANPNACGKCHLLASATQITATTHIDGIRNVGGQITDMDLVTGGNQLVAPGGWNGTCDNACHVVDTTGTWTDAAANKLACLECHISGKIGGAPASGLHVGPLTISGNTHDDSFQITRNEGVPSGTCTTCHSGIILATDDPPTHYAGGAAAPAQAALAADIYYVGGSPSTCAPKVGMVNCHDDRGGWSRKWSATARTDATPNNECGNCHGVFTTGWVSGVAQRHNDTQVGGGHTGIAGEQCYICHTYKEGSTLYYTFADGNDHRDGTIQINNNQMGFTDDGATVHCTGCHTTPLGLADGQYSFQDTMLASGGLNRWNRIQQLGPIATCNTCHNENGRDHGDTATESLAVHNAHAGSALNAGLGCGACHLDSGPSGGNHADLKVDFGGTYMSGMASYSGAAFPGSCTGANENGCHNSEATSWANDSLASCNDCHASGKLLDQGGYPPNSNAHGAHLGNAFYVGTIGVNACDPCHGAGSSVFNSLSTHSDGDVDVFNQVTSYTLLSAAGDGTCTNTCHTVVSGRDWNGGTLACLDCHEPSPSISLDVKNYTSGLHRTSQALAHDGDFPRPNAAPNGTCTSCHTAINLTTPASHVNGVTTDPNTAYGLFNNDGTYDTSAASTCSGTGVATNCHSDSGDWARKWNNVFNAKPQPADTPSSQVCRNCHGTFALGWNSLSASHIDPDPSNADDQMQAPGHAVCEKCHGWGNANYNRTWLGASNVNYDGHGDGHITMNGPAIPPTGTGYNPATGGCDTINCHGATPLTMNYNSGWPINYGDFGGAGACGSCHSGGKTPVSSSGAHDQHGASLSDQTTCYPCHPTIDYSTQAHGATDTFAAGISWNDQGNSDPNDDTCTTTICHSPAGNPAIWGSPASIGCNECHYYGGSGKALSVSHTKHFAKGLVCTDCHDDNTPDTVYPRTHMDATSGLLDKANAAMNEATLIAGARGTGFDPSEGAPGTATCNNAQCHNPSGGYLVTWLTSSTNNCDFCHSSTAPASGSHPQHMAAAGVFGRSVVCNDCHVNNGTNTAHRDGPVSFNGSTAYASLSCSTSLCHESAVGVDVPSPNWGTNGAISCGICHTNQPNSGAHIAHFSNLYGPLTDTDCSKCHAANANNTSMTGRSSHISGTVNFIDSGNLLAATTSCTTCHGGATDAATAKGRWATSTRVTCESCHDATPATINTATAQTRSDANFTTTGHGKSGVLQACSACHAENSAHISGIPDDANRLDTIGADFAVDPNTFCSTCHVSGTVEKAHYADGGDSLSNNGHQCALCHEPHGVGGQDAMIRSSINSKLVVGFSDRTLEDSYYVLTPNNGGNNQYGICQVCHAANDADASGGAISHFNTTTAANTGHADQACTGCHSHSSTPAFNASGGCTGCHGNATNGTFWPDGIVNNPSYPWADNQVGAHNVHIDAISAQLDGNKATAGTLAEKNATCNYCHPNPGSTSPDHKLETGVPGRVDLLGDGEFRYLIDGTTNGTGRFNYDTDGTCATLKCHARAPYTPGWHGDTRPPAAVTNLAATDNAARVNPEPGTVELTWLAPGDDDNDPGTAYLYDIRWSSTIIDNDTKFDSANRVASPPTALRNGKGQKMVVKGLTAGSSYYFAVKSRDEVGNWSPRANTTISAQAQPDNVPPLFYGIGTAVAGDSGNLLFTWDAARDHTHSLTTPILYKVWYGNYSLKTHLANSGTLPAIAKTCYDKDTTPPTVVTCDTPSEDYHIYYGTTTALKYQGKGLKYGNVYYALVRARDNVMNEDTRTDEAMVLAKAPKALSTTMATYRASGAVVGGVAPLSTSYGTVSSQDLAVGTSMVFAVSGSGYGSVKKNATGVSFEVWIEVAKVTGVVAQYEFGYWNGSTFTKLGTAPVGETAIGKSSKRVRKLPLNAFKGMVPAANNRPAVRITNKAGGGGAMTVRWGDNAYKGLLLVNEQDYNDLPSTVTVTTAVASVPTPGVVTTTWTPATDANGHAIHYDVYGSLNGDNDVDYKYVIAAGVCFDGTTYDPDCKPASGDETTTGIKWDTIGDGISGNQTAVRIRVAVGDGYVSGDGSGTHHNNVPNQEGNRQVNNSTDGWPPAAITTLAAETRPKQGSIALTWKAVGNDGLNHGSRATVYDIRYSTAPIPDIATFDALPNTNWAVAEPIPNFSGSYEAFELLGLNPDQVYNIAMKVSDGSNWSGLSNVVTTKGGPKCGICHATPPNEVRTAGNHSEHGFTMDDCAKCHGNDPVLGAQKFETDHQDGDIKLGWKTPTPYKGHQEGTRNYYTVDGRTLADGGVLIYDDNDGGSGGVNPTGPNADTSKDSGTCSGFAALGVNCHGPAIPPWVEGTELVCSACHGRELRTTGTATEYYPGREYDANIEAGVSAEIKEQIKAAPPMDNHGNTTSAYTGAHLKHLNASFRLAKGDNCRLCHKDANHADGNPDVNFDQAVTGGDGYYTVLDRVVLGPNGGPRCVGTNGVNCHNSNVPEWHSDAEVECVACHGFNMVNPPHIKDQGADQQCIYCHPAGHPQKTLQDPNSLLIPNNVTMGINYRSGGIHLLKAIGGRTTLKDGSAINGEAEICWGCHEYNNISEWGTNNKGNTGYMVYNYGTLETDKSRWSNGFWKSANQTLFAYKNGQIQSTHTANSAGSSTVTGNDFQKTETVDDDDLIRCSYCHDVHDMNKAEGDGVAGTVGAPYLRGTWKGNPYKEDGAPHSSTTYTAVNDYGAVPRGGTGYTQDGGYFIDQNSNSPTSGWSLSDSAGLCVLCHTDNVDTMDQKSGESLWLGTNGHSNSAIGGTAIGTTPANIFGDGVLNRPAPVGAGGSLALATHVPNMGYQSIADVGATTRAYGYRGLASGQNYLPDAGNQKYSYNLFNWGLTLADGGKPDVMFHNFSCSKCHNPHASRLPKLMITNCLDVRHNTWDDNKTSQTKWTAAALNNVDKLSTGGATGMKTAYYASAQNCHRYTRPETSYTPTNRGGWNKVTTW